MIPSNAKGMVDWDRLNKAINIEQGKTFPHKTNDKKVRLLHSR